jgi:hypothetical protein
VTALPYGVTRGRHPRVVERVFGGGVGGCGRCREAQKEQAMSSFCSDFLANLLSDLLVGLLLGTLLALWVGKRLGESERLRQRRDERRVELEKAIRYVELLKKETDDLLQVLPDVIREFKSTGWGLEFWLPTPRWDILQPSGELPRLLDPGLIEMLSLFYDHIRCANRGKQWLVQSWLVSNPSSVPGLHKKQEAFQQMTLLGLQSALDLGKRGLANKVSSGIEALKCQLEALN